jgi:hypothetical protein
LPELLHPLRDKAAAWAGIAPEDLTHALIAEYRPGTPLGWHRDVPDFEDIVGVSLLGDAVMQFRPYVPGAAASGPPTLEFLIEPRSVYVLRGPARWAWQHAIAPTEGLRYSITLRTRSARVNRGASAGARRRLPGRLRPAWRLLEHFSGHRQVLEPGVPRGLALRRIAAQQRRGMQRDQHAAAGRVFHPLAAQLRDRHRVPEQRARRRRAQGDDGARLHQP